MIHKEKEKLENVFEEGMKVHLRVLKSFIDLIKEEKSQQDIVNYISSRLNLIIEEKKNYIVLKPITQEFIRKIEGALPAEGGLLKDFVQQKRKNKTLKKSRT